LGLERSCEGDRRHDNCTQKRRQKIHPSDILEKRTHTNMKMALRLRKDVQKASYYVWFLGAQEAKGLRGSKVLLPAIPRLLERARIQEPLKVTLQISHKGLKIIQGSTKHFIPHGAITCSVQTEDIVACVLLLYNPATKCPLHVHAYRCDSEQTAIALNEQLQILINRPENQKRFNELETRLGYQLTQAPAKDAPAKVKQSNRRYESPRRFDSSLGSDTGTSTRESECSEEHSPPNTSPLVENTKLFDSLAAELRAKLNGNGPPLLLPPRDYDTVHRAQGNLAAIELRRCRNTCIVGPGVGKNVATKQVVSSRGSSGIGSDLAPSPERHDGQTSSDEDWVNDHQESVIIMPATQTRNKKLVEEKKQPLADRKKFKEPVTSYIYPREPVAEKKPVPLPPQTRYQRSSSRDGDTSPGGDEEEVKPVLTKSVPIEKRFREVFKIKDYAEERRKYSSDEDRMFIEDLTPAKELYKKQPAKPSKYSREMEYRGNKVDRQKYRETPQANYEDDDFGFRQVDRNQVERTKSLKRYETRRDSFDEESSRYRNRSSEPTRYRDISPDDYRVRNPYRQPEATPYQESIEKMMKSPVMRYKSFEEAPARYERETEKWDKIESYPEDFPRIKRPEERQRMNEHRTPDSTLQKASPRDRFQNAKEKFQAMERERLAKKQDQVKINQNRRSVERFESLPAYPGAWSSDDEAVPIPRKSYKELPPKVRYPGLDRDPPSGMLPAKSLGNLVKGYRHSYAEPRNFPRTGRVGLAAVNPY